MSGCGPDLKQADVCLGKFCVESGKIMGGEIFGGNVFYESFE